MATLHERGCILHQLTLDSIQLQDCTPIEHYHLINNILWMKLEMGTLYCIHCTVPQVWRLSLVWSASCWQLIILLLLLSKGLEKLFQDNPSYKGKRKLTDAMRKQLTKQQGVLSKRGCIESVQKLQHDLHNILGNGVLVKSVILIMTGSTKVKMS